MVECTLNLKSINLSFTKLIQTAQEGTQRCSVVSHGGGETIETQATAPVVTFVIYVGLGKICV